MMRSGLIASLASVALIVSTVGCDSSGKLAASRESAYQSCKEADAAFENQDYQVARDLFTQAIDSGSLNIDVYVSSMIKRAVCFAALGDIDGAHAELDKVEQGPSDMDLVYSARSYVFAKEGRKKEAKAAWSRARRINRGVHKFQD